MKVLNNFIKNKSVVTIAAFAVCIIIIIFAYNRRVDQAINAISVPVAAEALEGRTQITSDKIKTVKLASSMITKDVLTYKKDIVDKFVNYNTYIPEGSLFYSSAVVEWKTMPDSAWSNIPDGNTIVSLSVNNKTTYGNSIYPGDKIDLYYQTFDENGLLVVGKLIEGIQILAVKDEYGNHIFKKSAEQKKASALIFSVDEDYHLLLRKAHYLDGEIIPVPRSYGNIDEIQTTITSTYLKNLILDQTLDIKPDVIDPVVDENGEPIVDPNSPNIVE